MRQPGDVPEIGLLDVPRLRPLMKGGFVGGLLAPWVLLAAVLILVPRVLLILVLLVLRILRVGSYWLYTKAPGPLGCLTIVVAFPLFLVLSFLMLPFFILLSWNLTLSGFDSLDATFYVNTVIGPVIGTQD